MAHVDSDYLRGQTALVTGAAKRLGRSIVLGLADRGVNVVVHYRSSVREAEETADEVRQRGAEAWALSADLEDFQAASRLVARAADLAGRPLDILINSASVFEPSRLLEFPPEALERNVRLHGLAPLLLARSMAAQGRGAQIVNVLDTRILEFDRLHAAYHLSKRMLFTLTRMLARELAPTIRVNAVAPGLILPPEGKDASYLERLAEKVPLRAHGHPQDVVRATLFLLDSPFITGQVIYVDGGQHMLGSMYGA